MRHSFLITGFTTVLLLIYVGTSFCQVESVPGSKQTEQTIVGLWHADSVTLLSSTGSLKTLHKANNRPISVIITENNLTICVGDEKFADMSYTLADKMQNISLQESIKSPATIDLKLDGQEMRGIYVLKGDALQISWNDSKKGRPTKVDDPENDMSLALKRFRTRPLMLINSDGTNLRTLLSMTEYNACGSPEWSHDGKKIAFDCWRSLYGENYGASHVFTVNPDGSEPKDIVDGTMPSWSPDSKQIAYSRYNPHGIWVINADSSDNRIIDPNGWGVDWSPKTDELAYIAVKDNNQNICVYDLKTKEKRYLLEKKYRSVSYGLSWSPDGKWICFKGDLPDGKSEVAIVHSEGQAKGFNVLLPNKNIPGVKSTQKYFSWSPDGRQVVLPMTLEGDTNIQLYLVDIEGNKPPQRLADQDPNENNYASSWSPDGKQMVTAFSFGKKAKKKDK